MSQQWPLPERFRIRLTMESDWHVGSGMGRPGNIDRLIARDADDLPFVPAKTLRGIWRDACERLCRGLDDGQLGVWSRLVDRLFGSQPALGPNDPTQRHQDPTEIPLESAVQIRPARIAESLIRLLRPLPLSNDEKHNQEIEKVNRERQLLRQALTFIKPGVKIDRRSGSAETECLRFEEMARKGTVLEAECRLAIRDPSTCEMASALLIASARLVERLGGKRRRGTGRCRLEILDADTTTAIDWLERTTSPPQWSTDQERSASSDTRHVVDRADPWVCVPLVLHLQGPLAVSHRTTGNVVETLDFVPGSYLLPHVTRTLSGLGLDVRSALQVGDVCVLPAYPEVDGERGQPVPLAWFAPKGVEKPLRGANRAKVVNRLLQADATDGTQLKQMRDGYVSTRPQKLYKTPITVLTHNTVEDQLQRPSENVGGVYTYEAIAASDQGKLVVLRSELRIRKSLADRFAQSDAKWFHRLNGEVALGRSKKDDYGYVRLEAEEPAAFTSDAVPRKDQLLFVWLVSDTLIRNSRLRPEPTAACLGEELSRRLGVTLKLRESTNDQLDELVRIRRLETWHVGWGLPRPSLVALQAGSCMVFQAEGSIDPTKLAQVEAGGIGERTAEGYGQVCFNHPLLTEKLEKANDTEQQDVANSGTRKMLSATDPAFAFARLIERECWKQEIRRACLAIAAEAKKRKELLGWDSQRDIPPMSQLGGLRGQLMLMQKSEQRKQVLDWLHHLDQNKRRKEKWPSIPKVKAFIESDSRIWEVIDTGGWPTLTTKAQEELKRELWALAVRTLFDACIRAHKRELEVARGA